MRVPARLAAALCTCVLAGCAALPPLEDRTTTTAVAAGPGSVLHEAVAARTAEHPALTGIHALDDGRAAFAARVALAEAATRSLDVQYYIWKDDVSGRLLTETLRRAAERGVRVRLLLDDNNTAGLDRTLAALEAHPNIEVRLFNPFRNRALRTLGYLTDFTRLNRRMHNKSFTADGVATIVGGRNVGDEYFAAGGGVQFYDLDVIAVGAVVREVARSFDDYWNSASAYTVESLVPAASDADVARLERIGRETAESEVASAYADALRDTPAVRELMRGRLPLEWCEVRLIVDDPAKALGRARRERLLVATLDGMVGTVQRELHAVSPYFVPMRRGVRTFTELAARGVKVTVLTNAFESTDVAAVHAGYAKRRRALLRGGVALYELKRDLAPQPVGGDEERGFGSGSRARGSASLHAKTFAVDRELLFVGSFNFDPRSAALNTEMGLLIRSPALAGRLAALFETTLPAWAYAVELGPRGRLQWREWTPSGEVVHADEPGMAPLQRFGIGLLARLPIEWLL